MEMIDREQFQFENNQYEVRLHTDGIKIIIRAFKDEKPANGFVYETTLSEQADIKKLTSVDTIKYFMDLAKNDIYEQRYEKLIDAMKLVREKKE